MLWSFSAQATVPVPQKNTSHFSSSSVGKPEPVSSSKSSSSTQSSPPPLIKSPHESMQEFAVRTQADRTTGKELGISHPVREKGEKQKHYDKRIDQYNSDVWDAQAAQHRESLNVIRGAKPQSGESEEQFQKRQEKELMKQKQQYAQKELERGNALPYHDLIAEKKQKKEMEHLEERPPSYTEKPAEGHETVLPHLPPPYQEKPTTQQKIRPSPKTPPPSYAESLPKGIRPPPTYVEAQ